jgi:hypothetical protein
LPIAFFIAPPLVRRSASCADDADGVLGYLDEDDEQNASLVRLANKNRSLRIKCVLQHRGERVGDH